MLDCQTCSRPFEFEGSAHCNPCRDREAGVVTATHHYTGGSKPLGDRRMGERKPRAKVAQVVPCMRCGQMYERERLSGHFCAVCRVHRHRETDAERYERLKEEAAAQVRLLVPDVDIPTLDHYLNDMDLEPDDDWPIVMDQMPDGASSPYGPDEGRSSFFEDLRLELDLLSLVASRVQWWADNPHWNFELHSLEHASEYFAKLERDRQRYGCGDARGEQRGYQRHLARGESPCDECTKAQADYIGRWRRRNHR